MPQPANRRGIVRIIAMLPLEKMSNFTMPAGALAIQAIGTFLYAWVVGVTAKNEALLTIILIMLALVFLTAAGGRFSQKSNYAIVTESGFVVAMTIVMIIVQGIF